MATVIGDMQHYYVGVHIPTAGEDAFLYVLAPVSIPMDEIKEILQNHPDFKYDEIQHIEITTRSAARTRGGDFHENAFDNACLILE